jgi:hypothetical protein
VGNGRRDLLAQVIVLNVRHLQRLMNEYISCYHEDQTHLALEKETPAGRVTAKNSGARSRVIDIPRIGGLRRRYELAAQAFALELSNKVEKKRRRSASVDLSRDLSADSIVIRSHRKPLYPVQSILQSCLRTR